MTNWSDPIERVVNEGRLLIKSQDLNGIANLRYELATWRGYVSNQYAELNQKVAQIRQLTLAEQEKPSVAKAEAASEASDEYKEMLRAKEMLNTINQLVNACSTVIAVLLAEKGQGNLDKI